MRHKDMALCKTKLETAYIEDDLYNSICWIRNESHIQCHCSAGPDKQNCKEQ